MNESDETGRTRRSPEPTVVAALTDPDRDKYYLLAKTLELSRFFEALEKRRNDLGKERRDFRIVIKPNLSMMLRRNDVGTYTDPFLVIHLLRILLKNGFTNLAVVESQNLYGNWFENRSVVQVAARSGYLDESLIESGEGMERAMIRVRGGGVDAQVPLVDLTYDRMAHDFGGGLGEFEVGRTWAEADFRINFAKMKSHFYSRYSLAIKNVYGCMPEQDKVRGYHCRRLVGKLTARLIRDFPVHFSIIDAYTAADGWLGVKIKAVPKKPHTLIAGEDIVAVDRFGAGLLGIDSNESVMYREAAEVLGEMPYTVAGDYSPPQRWRNPPAFMAWASLLIESDANIMDYMGALATGGHDECFPKKASRKSLLSTLIYSITVPVNLAMDLGYLKLAWRRRVFARRMKSLSDRLPAISGSDFLIIALSYFSKPDFFLLEKILGDLDDSSRLNPLFSGHFFFLQGKQYQFPARLSTTNFAALDVFSWIGHGDSRIKVIRDEVRVLAEIYEKLFQRSDARYSYCFK